MTRRTAWASAVGTNGYTRGEERDYFASCGCGWLETGWPTEAAARERLMRHQGEAHPPEPLEPQR